MPQGWKRRQLLWCQFSTASMSKEAFCLIGVSQANAVSSCAHPLRRSPPTDRIVADSKLSCLIIVIISSCWCCSCIPYCADSFQNADHYCPNCNTYIGTYQHQYINYLHLSKCSFGEISYGSGNQKPKFVIFLIQYNLTFQGLRNSFVHILGCMSMSV